LLRIWQDKAFHMDKAHLTLLTVIYLLHPLAQWVGATTPLPHAGTALFSRLVTVINTYIANSLQSRYTPRDRWWLPKTTVAVELPVDGFFLSSNMLWQSPHPLLVSSHSPRPALLSSLSSPSSLLCPVVLGPLLGVARSGLLPPLLLSLLPVRDWYLQVAYLDL